MCLSCVSCRYRWRLFSQFIASCVYFYLKLSRVHIFLRLPTHKLNSNVHRICMCAVEPGTFDSFSCPLSADRCLSRKKNSYKIRKVKERCITTSIHEYITHTNTPTHVHCSQHFINQQFLLRNYLNFTLYMPPLSPMWTNSWLRCNSFLFCHRWRKPKIHFEL